MLNLYLTLIDTDEDKLKFTDLYKQYRHLMFYVARRIVNGKLLTPFTEHE